MQERHRNKELYFKELSATSEEFYLPYLSKYNLLNPKCRVLEIGCGVGGNVFPFANIGCEVVGIDCSAEKIESAKMVFADVRGSFIARDFFSVTPNELGRFDIILIHDVIEHIPNKDAFVKHALEFADDKSVFFWRFPAWRMPFGGHQQVCKSKFLSHAPYIHLLPKFVYGFVLKSFGEDTREFLEIKDCRMHTHVFEKLMTDNNMGIIDRTLWFINPHYKQKFKLEPRRLYYWLSKIRYIRDFFSTSCYYLTRLK